MSGFYKSLSSHVRYHLESYATASTGSSFPQTGKITPDDFLKAGDDLVESSPWIWATWDEGGPLPDYITQRKNKEDREKKHYLLFQNVRLDNTIMDREDLDIEANDDWTIDEKTGVDNKAAAPSLPVAEKLESKPQTRVDEDPIVGSGDEGEGGNEVDDDDDDDDIDDAIWEEDDVVAEQHTDTRTYDVYMVYSTRHEAAQTFFTARTTGNKMLSPEQVLMDFSADYRNKTVTVEVFPLSNKKTMYAGVHVCHIPKTIEKHIERIHLRAHRRAMQNESDEWDHIAEDQLVKIGDYFPMYLKIISTMMPNLILDYSVSM